MTLRIRNWDRWQCYRKDRGQPPWIKIHRQLLRDANWVALTDAQRGQLVAIWMLAADRNGVIPASPALVRKLCFMDSEPDFNLFIEKGFIDGCHDGVKLTPERRPHDAPEERREEKNGADAPSDEKQLFDRGVAILGPKGRGLIAKLLKSKGSIPLARSALELAATKSDATEYICRIIAGKPAIDGRHGPNDPLAGIV